MLILALVLFLNLRKKLSDHVELVFEIILTFGKMSILLVLCLALDRSFAVVRPIQYRYFTTRRVAVYLAIILIYAVSFSIPNILLLHGKTLNYVKTIDIVLTFLIPIPATWIMFV